MPITGLDRMPGTGLARGTLFDKDLNTNNIVSSTLTSTNSIILEKASENSYTISWTQPSGADRILSIPAMSSADTFAFLAATQTFTNKTLTAPTISGGTVTAITDLDMTVGNKTILDTIGSNTLTIGAGGTTVVIAGNLTVSGATTTTVSNTLLVEDSLYVLNHGETGTPSEDAGFVVERGDDTNVGFIWDESADEFVVINTSSTGTETGNVTIASYANLQVATAQMSALNIGGTAVTATAAEINLIDGGTARGTTSVASGDGILINDGGTMRMTNVDTVSTYFASHSVGGSNIVTTGALDSGSITSGFGTINNGSSAISTTGTITYGSLSDGTISVTAWADEDDMSSDSATLVPTQQSVKAYVDNQQSMGSGFVMEDGDGTEVTITESKEMKFVEGGGIDINWTDTDNGTDGDPYDLTVTINAAQTDITSIYATDLIMGEDAETAIDFGTANEIDFKVDNAARLTLTSGALYPVTNNQIDLGTNSLEFKDAFFDGTVTADAFAGALTGNVTGNASGTAATVTGASQSAITSLGTLTGLAVNGAVTVNDNHASVDFRIESDTNEYMFFVDGSANKVGINTSSPELPFHIESSGSGSGVQNLMMLKATRSGGTNAAVGGWGMGIQWKGENGTNDEYETMAELQVVYSDVTTNSENTRFDLKTLNGIGGGNSASAKILSIERAQITPDEDDYMNLGKSDKRFDDIYATNGTIQTSDMRDKTQIKPAELGLDFVGSLNPVSYKWKSKVDEPTHYGLLAQEVIENLKDNGIDSIQDFGGITGSDDGRYGARYTEFVPILIKAIQELTNTVNELDEKIKILEEK